MGLSLFTALAHSAQDNYTDGLSRLLARRLPNHVDDCQISLTDPVGSSDDWINNEYTVFYSDGNIHVEGNSLSGLLQG